MEFRILGPLEAVADGDAVSLGAAKPRALLAILLLHANEQVSSDRLIEALWAEQPPATAAKVLQSYISQLRRALGNGTIATRPAGYELRVEPGGLDSHRFERLVAEARGADSPAAARKLRKALALWRGPPLLDFAFDPWAQAEIRRLEELRLDALQERIDADLALGRHAELVVELELLVAEHPLLERLRSQHILALYRSGRQAEALEAYRNARQTLVATLGIEPGTSLRELERAILHQDPELDVSPVTPLVPAPERAVPSLHTTTSFIGRRRELREIPALLRRRDVRVLTMTGAGGSGKTRLAVEATDGIGDAFPDGVVLVELAPIRYPELVEATLARSLGVSEKPGTALTEVLIAYLSGRQSLLLLDNFEHVLAAATLVSTLSKGAPGVTFLITSRAPLDITEERVYPVPPLQLPDSVLPAEMGQLRRTEAIRLFVDRAHHSRADFALSESNADAVVGLAVRLDGLPLALELAAARIRLLSPAEILERLARHLEPLKAAPGAEVPERHRTLEAAIAWSYDLLTAEEQSLFTSLAAFVGGFTLEAAAAVAADVELDIADGVESLLNNNLLRTERMAGGDPRFGMLETIREFSLERLAERGDGEARRRRHAGFFALLAERAEPELRGPRQVSWLERLDADLANIRGALTWATESGEAEIGLRVGAALWRFWHMRGHLIEGRERLERLLAVGSGSAGARASVQWAVASIANVQGDHEAVRRLLEASLPVHRSLGDDWRVATSLAVLTSSAIVGGDADRALALAEEGLVVARRSGDLSTEAMLLFNVGMALAWRGELDEAERAIEESVHEGRQAGNATSVGNWLRALGSISLARHDYEGARPRFEESLALGREFGQPWCISHALSDLALVALETRDQAAARQLLAESVAMQREPRERLGLAANLEMYGRLAAAQGHSIRAARLYACASALREDVGVDPCEPGWPDPGPNVSRLRAAMGVEAFTEAWDEGRMLTLDEALDYALGEELDDERTTSRRLRVQRA